MLTVRRDAGHRQARADQEPARQALARDRQLGRRSGAARHGRSRADAAQEGEDRARRQAAPQADRRDRRRPRSQRRQGSRHARRQARRERRRAHPHARVLGERRAPADARARRAVEALARHVPLGAQGQRRFVEGRVRPAARRDQQAVRADVLRRSRRRRRGPQAAHRHDRPLEATSNEVKVPDRELRRQRVRHRLLRERHVPAVHARARAAASSAGCSSSSAASSALLVLLGFIGYLMQRKQNRARRCPAAEWRRQPKGAECRRRCRTGAAGHAAERPPDPRGAHDVSGPRDRRAASCCSTAF